MKPLILINFKLYPEATGEKAIRLAKSLSKIKSKKFHIALAPPTSTLSEMRKMTSSPLFAQHADPVLLGAFTGHTSPAELKSLSIQGTILNHSERKISLDQLYETMKICKHLALQTIICASSLAEIKKVARFQPEFLAYEPKELIGGNVSVTSARPAVIAEAVRLCKRLSPKTRLLCGAGVHSKEDLKTALTLGAEGVLIGHAIPKAKNPKEKLKEILN